MPLTDSFNALRQHDLNQLKVMGVLLTTQSVTKAAAQLDMSQPAMSKCLDRLRREFDDPLLVRDGNRMRLTPRAQALLPQVEDVLSSLSGLFAAHGPFDPASARGRLRIGANDYAQIVIGTHLMHRMRALAPGVAVEFRPVGAIHPEHLLVEGVLDLAIGPQWPNMALRSQALYRDPFVCVAAADSKGVPARLDLMAFSELQHLDVSPSGADILRALIDHAIGEQGGRREVRLVVSSFMAVPAMLAGSDLVSLMPSRALASLAPGSVRVIELDFSLPSYEVSLWWHNVTHADPLARWVREQMVQLTRQWTTET
jgi:DNA-binding transcriptional LysR family regulator